MHPRHVTIGLTLALALAGSAAAQTILYVDQNADQPPDGSSWCTAYRTLDEALDVADAGTIIRVADGIYSPDPSGLADPREATYELITGLTVAGGYAGCGATDPDDHDIALYETVLSGDIGTPDDPGDNCYHVVTCDGLGTLAVLDGFTISGGNTDGSGAGLDNWRGSPIVISCTFADNTGGAIYSYEGDLLVIDCTFTGNSTSSGGRGGALYAAWYSDAIVTGCTFNGNTADHYGGAIGVGQGSSLTLEYCTFTGNSTTSHGGGAVWVTADTDVTVVGCTFADNSATADGGAIYFGFSDAALVSDCTFSGNTAGERGGGIIALDSHLTLTGCAFTSNWADDSGGGIYGTAMVGLTDCTFTDNAGRDGGGVYALNLSGPVSNCTFTGNSATRDAGGLLVYSNDDATVTNCVFTGNSAGDNGGAIYRSGPGSVSNCVLAGNSARRGGAVYSSGPATVSNCTITDNSATEYGGGLFGGDLTVTNCILWGNAASQWGPEIYNVETVTYTCIAGGWPGVGNFDDDPLLDSDGAHLLDGSPCIDVGDPEADYSGQTDIDGDERVQYGRVDVGADECSYYRDCNVNDTPDAYDVDPNDPDGNGEVSPDCNGNGFPDECEPGGTEDCNGNQVPDLCDIFEGTTPDCNGNGVPDGCDIADQTSVDCNDNGIPDECETDCNGNGVHDDCDIADETSDDCNANGIPDECDVLRGAELYAAERWTIPYHDVFVYLVDPSTAELTLAMELSDMGIDGVTGLGFSPDGELYVLGDGDDGFDLINVDLDTGGFSTIGTIDWNDYAIADIAFTDDGTLYGVAAGWTDPNDGVPGELFTISTADATITSTGLISGDGGGQSIASMPGTNLLFHVATDNDTQLTVLRAIDMDTGTLAVISDTLTQRYQSLTYDLSAGVLLGASFDELYAIEPPTGQETLIGLTNSFWALGGMAFRGGCRDCNDNGVPDQCDIAEGTSPDDNQNGVPDECEEDCNDSGLPDFVDILFGLSPDDNGNGIPDECEECPGDLDGDNDVDIADLAQLLGHYGMTEGATYEDGDLDGDGDVDIADLAELLGVYGTTCE